METRQASPTTVPVMAPRVIDKKLHMTYSHSSISAFKEKSEINSGIHSVWHTGLPIDMLISTNKSDKLVVVFHGAKTRETTLPWLTGQTVTSGFPINKVFISDPTLYLSEELKSGWHSGSIQQPDLQVQIDAVIRHIQSVLGIKRTVLLGGSAGGFAALRYAWAIPDSIAIAMNPQVDIRKSLSIKTYESLAWQNQDFTTIDTLDYDLTKLYSRRADNYILYMQNSTDHHVQKHLVPFLESHIEPRNLRVIAEPWREGHYPPPKELIIRQLEIALSNTWDTSWI